MVIMRIFARFIILLLCVELTNSASLTDKIYFEHEMQCRTWENGKSLTGFFIPAIMNSISFLYSVHCVLLLAFADLMLHTSYQVWVMEKKTTLVRSLKINLHVNKTLYELCYYRQLISFALHTIT